MGRFSIEVRGEGCPPEESGSWAASEASTAPEETLEISGLQKIQVRFPTEILKVYQRQVLERGLCKGLLEVRSLFREGGQWLYYDRDGLQTLEEYLEREGPGAGKLPGIFSGVVSSLLEAEDQLLSAKLFPLTMNRIFIEPASGAVRLACLPGEGGSEGFPRRFSALLEAVEERCEDAEWLAYSPGIRRTITENSLGPASVLRLLNEKEREIHHRQWPAAALNRQVVREEPLPDWLGISEVAEEKESFLTNLLRKFF